MMMSTTMMCAIKGLVSLFGTTRSWQVGVRAIERYFIKIVIDVQLAGRVFRHFPSSYGGCSGWMDDEERPPSPVFSSRKKRECIYQFIMSNESKSPLLFATAITKRGGRERTSDSERAVQQELQPLGDLRRIFEFRLSSRSVGSGLAVLLYLYRAPE